MNYRKSYAQKVGFGLFLLIALWMMIEAPFSPGLEPRGHLMLGAVLISIGIWVIKPFGLPYSMGALFLAAFGLIAGLRPGIVFSGFAESAVWTLVPALFFGTVLRKTGLGKSIAFGIMRLFRPSYPSLICAWAVIGIVLSIFTPSMTVRVAIMIPIAMQCCELCALKKGSKGQSLIMLTAFAMAILPGSGWLTGVLWGPIVQGLYNAVPEMEGLITFDSWLSVMLLPQALISLLMLVISYFVLRPEDKISAVASLQTGEDTKLSAQAKTAGVILLIVFAMFISSGLHGLPTAAICLAAVIAFFALKILTTEDIGTGISWDMVIFVAMALSINSIFTATGISSWLSGIIIPAIGPIAGDPMLFTLFMLAILFAWRFFDIALFIPTMAILVPVLPSIQEAYGINPLLWLPLFIMAANCFFMNYQNMWAMMGSSMAGERSWTQKHLAAYGTIYFVVCVIVVALMIPLWNSLGVF
ncbi:MAG: SLC13 family permease [Treponema sp.]|nr:SLC13 family permease [Treponema sp.]